MTGAGLEAESDPATWRPLYPYHTPQWRLWLAARDAGLEPPLPTDAEAFRAFIEAERGGDNLRQAVAWADSFCLAAEQRKALGLDPEAAPPASCATAEPSAKP